MVDAALALIAERGLDGLSMRALGEALGVEAMSLYHWFPPRTGCSMPSPTACSPGRVPPTPTAADLARLDGRGRALYRRVGLAHRRAFPLLATRRFLSPGAAAFLQANVAAHLAAGFTVREALRLTRSIGAYINGIVLAECSPPSPSPQTSLHRRGTGRRRQAVMPI